jgi:hypothetical protein
MRHLLSTVALCAFLSCAAAQQPLPEKRPPAPSLQAVSGTSTRVDARGFIHRWLVLEPLPVAGRLTESAVQEALQTAALPTPADILPRAGESLTLNGTPLTWHAFDTVRYNFNLYHFAWALSKPTSNVLFWITTTVDSPREMQGVRLAIGSNAASRWWVNGELVVALNDDRQSVIDDGVSPRLTLRKGRNVIRAAVINGGGATDFCARFLDAQDQPVRDLAVSLQPR